MFQDKPINVAIIMDLLGLRVWTTIIEYKLDRKFNFHSNQIALNLRKNNEMSLKYKTKRNVLLLLLLLLCSFVRISIYCISLINGAIVFCTNTVALWRWLKHNCRWLSHNWCQFLNTLFFWKFMFTVMFTTYFAFINVWFYCIFQSLWNIGKLYNLSEV